MQKFLYLPRVHKIVNHGGYKIVSKLRRTCAVAVLAAVLAVPAFAGIIDSPGAVPPPPPPTSTSTSTTTIILTILSLIR